jgi:hypothetical protein
MSDRNRASRLPALAGSVLSFACAWSISYADCAQSRVSGDHHRGWRIASAPGLLVFGVAGDVFAEPDAMGVAYVYSLSPDLKLSLAGRLSLPASSGIELKISETFIIVGLPGADTATRNAEDVGVIKRGSAQWAREAPVRRAGQVLVWSRQDIRQKPRQFVATRPAEFAGFGGALAFEGTRLAVGAPDEDGHGAIYVFDLASLGKPVQRIAAPSDTSGFGTSIEFWDDQLIVGAPEQCCRGSVFSFRKTAADWVESKRVRNPVAGTTVTYGQSMERGSTFLVVAGNGVDAGDGAPEPGAIDVYLTPDLSSKSFMRLRPNDTGPAPFGNAGTAVAVGNRILINRRTGILEFVRDGNGFREARRISAVDLGVPAVYQLTATEQWLGYGHAKRDVGASGDIWQLCTVAF